MKAENYNPGLRFDIELMRPTFTLHCRVKKAAPANRM